jgi:squalene-associated FAD-dependent desaturase
MTKQRAFVVGAGLAGLSAAVSLAEKDVSVVLFESAPQAGGRCRSYFDPTLAQTIDNGNHFIVSGNHAAFAYLKLIGTADRLVAPDSGKGVSFVDIRNGARWTLKPNDGMFPTWLLDSHRRVPGTVMADYLAMGRLLVAGNDKTIGDVIRCEGALWERLLRPFFLGALNTQPEIASAALAGALVRETFARGGKAYRTRIAHPTLASVFVDPALEFLTGHAADIHLGERVRRVVPDISFVNALELSEQTIPLARQDAVILAVPPWVASELVPQVRGPDRFSAIVNAHFRLAAPKGSSEMLGIIGGTAEWVFCFEDRISITVSSADRLVDTDREELAAMFWSEVQQALGIADPLPPWQIVKEKRATFMATPEQAAKRPAAVTAWNNLFLAGDWTDTGLPATIEGAVRSGQKAANLALRHIGH